VKIRGSFRYIELTLKIEVLSNRREKSDKKLFVKLLFCFYSQTEMVCEKLARAGVGANGN